MRPDFFCWTDVENECESVNSQSMCLSVRSEDNFHFDTLVPPF